jgi:hypothetical protein
VSWALQFFGAMLISLAILMCAWTLCAVRELGGIGHVDVGKVALVCTISVLVGMVGCVCVFAGMELK